MTALRYERLKIKSSARHYLTDTHGCDNHWGQRCAPGCCRITRIWRFCENDTRQSTLSEDSIRTTASLDKAVGTEGVLLISEELNWKVFWKKLIHSLLECAGAQHITICVRRIPGMKFRQRAIPCSRKHASYRSGRQRIKIFHLAS